MQGIRGAFYALIEFVDRPSAFIQVLSWVVPPAGAVAIVFAVWGYLVSIPWPLAAYLGASGFGIVIGLVWILINLFRQAKEKSWDVRLMRLDGRATIDLVESPASVRQGDETVWHLVLWNVGRSIRGGFNFRIYPADARVKLLPHYNTLESSPDPDEDPTVQGVVNGDLMREDAKRVAVLELQFPKPGSYDLAYVIPLEGRFIRRWFTVFVT